MKLPIKWVVQSFVSLIKHLDKDLLLSIVRLILLQIAGIDPKVLQEFSKVLRDLRPGNDGIEEDIADFIDQIDGASTRSMLKPDTPILVSKIEEDDWEDQVDADEVNEAGRMYGASSDNEDG